MTTSPAELQAIRERDAHGPSPHDMFDDHIEECHVDRRTLLALYDAQSDEVRRLREVLTNYGKHNLACASAWPASDGSFQKCNCGFDAALAPTLDLGPCDCKSMHCRECTP